MIDNDQTTAIFNYTNENILSMQADRIPFTFLIIPNIRYLGRGRMIVTALKRQVIKNILDLMTRNCPLLLSSSSRLEPYELFESLRSS
ncbi:unnamed protein product [Moneuplotes crassus]|uniref:Uncharacterized protein n=1 Tax=Euplotes crassus TaxID=5936 RepID=A0AAD1YAP9_EUPCR|nr:unnamed protein product [Moneuplotes crassus]